MNKVLGALALVVGYKSTSRSPLNASVLCASAALFLVACMPNIEPEPADIAGFWVGEIDDSSWCMQLAEDASVRYLSVIPKVNEFGVAVAGEYMNIVANGSYTLEPGGRLTLELTAMGVTNRMPLLLAQVSADKMVYYESQENDRTKFISRRVDSCNGFFEKHQSSGSA